MRHDVSPLPPPHPPLPTHIRMHLPCVTSGATRTRLLLPLPQVDSISEDGDPHSWLPCLLFASPDPLSAPLHTADPCGPMNGLLCPLTSCWVQSVGTPSRKLEGREGREVGVFLSWLIHTG